MANTKNAKKAHRSSLRKRVFNVRRKKAIHDTVKAVSKAISAKSKDAGTLLPELYQAVDKAAKHGTISKNTASRMKSRITKRVAALSK
ncbi:30S ribosomal protein S20 [Candidatus Parcubacteria bacterium]|nr:MAG: 30S ribosomal protein S20 [Candidatus Parcubacteria bacterium]